MKYSRLTHNIMFGLKDLLHHKGRSILTSLGVVFGVGSVIAMLSVGEGASEQAISQIRKLGSKNILISSIQPVDNDDSGISEKKGSMSIYGLLYDDELRIRTSLPNVKSVSENRRGSATKEWN